MAREYPLGLAHYAGLKYKDMEESGAIRVQFKGLYLLCPPTASYRATTFGSVHWNAAMELLRESKMVTLA